jgi:hypothetical protein
MPGSSMPPVASLRKFSAPKISLDRDCQLRRKLRLASVSVATECSVGAAATSGTHEFAADSTALPAVLEASEQVGG